MSDITINVESGTQTRLLTAGKYCADNILVTASGGGTEIADTILDKSVITYSSSALLTLANNVFERCADLTKVILPNCTSVGENVFLNCTALNFCYFPAVKVFAYGTFTSCTALQILKLESINTMNRGRTFQNSGLEALIIDSQTIPSVSNDAFAGTPIAAGTGYIYVPDDLVDQYKSTGNWPTYTAQIKGLSEIPPDVQQWLDEQESSI